MKDFVSLVESGMDWRSYDRKFFFWDRPPREVFTRFVARKLKDKFDDTPSAVSLRIDRANRDHLFVVGTVLHDNSEDRIAGEVVWMPNLNNFRGHLLINPLSGEELPREEIEELRKQEWTLSKWKCRIPDETHGHCQICWETFYEEPGDDAKPDGYTDGCDWVCLECYGEHLSPVA
jgi:hypothetical protein